MSPLVVALAVRYFLTTSLANARAMVRENAQAAMTSYPEVIERTRAVLPTQALRPFDELVAVLKDWKE